MDYKYIEQLLERYWRCETTLEEEGILRAFFGQKEVPAHLESYKPLFEYAQEAKAERMPDDGFDERMLALIGEPEPVKARRITLTHRLMPLFKAAAVVAIFLSLGNAAQMPYSEKAVHDDVEVAGVDGIKQGPSVAMKDTLKADTAQRQASAATMLNK